MSIEIDWLAFVSVFVAALIGAGVVVLFYALGLRLLVRGGRAPVVGPVEFTDAITIVTDKELRRAEKAAAKAAKRSELTQAQRRLALVCAYACFVLCGAAVLGGVLLIVIGH